MSYPVSKNKLLHIFIHILPQYTLFFYILRGKKCIRLKSNRILFYLNGYFGQNKNKIII